MLLMKDGEMVLVWNQYLNNALRIVGGTSYWLK